MIEAALVAALLVSNLAWLVARDRDGKRAYDERSELLTRVQQPQLVNPRALLDRDPPKMPEPDPDLAELALAGSIQDREVLRSD